MIPAFIDPLERQREKQFDALTPDVEVARTFEFPWGKARISGLALEAYRLEPYVADENQPQAESKPENPSCDGSLGVDSIASPKNFDVWIIGPTEFDRISDEQRISFNGFVELSATRKGQW